MLKNLAHFRVPAPLAMASGMPACMQGRPLLVLCAALAWASLWGFPAYSILPHRAPQSRTVLKAARRNKLPRAERRRRSSIMVPESSHLGQDRKLKYERKQDEVIQAARKRTEEARQDFEKSNAKIQAMERASWVKKVREAAEKALCASPTNTDNFGGLEIVWTEPPIVRGTTAEVRAFLRCQRGEALAAIDGKDVQQMGCAQILQELAVFDGSIRFLPLDKTIVALFTAFAKQRALSEEQQGVAEEQQGVAEEYEGGPLRLIGQMLQALVLIPLLVIALLASLAIKCFLGKAASPAQVRSSVRRFAEKALRRGPRALLDYPEGHNWIGGLDMIWTSPPMVRRVKPHLQQISDFEPGDRLVSVGDQPTEALRREEVLQLLSGSNSGLAFMKGERWQQRKDEEMKLQAAVRKVLKDKGSRRGFNRALEGE
ncbi:unnamed protein product [Symbiodinium sp. KB8]|nr:unnamed protein product [Symbiodinium sp. KB8]